jgi:hypothetical protein
LLEPSSAFAAAAAETAAARMLLSAPEPAVALWPLTVDALAGALAKAGDCASPVSGSGGDVGGVCRGALVGLQLPAGDGVGLWVIPFDGIVGLNFGPGAAACAGWAAVAAGFALGAAAAVVVGVGSVDAVLCLTLVATAARLTGVARAVACERKIFAASFARAIASDAAAVSGVAVANRRVPAAAAGATGAAVAEAVGAEAVVTGKHGLCRCGGGTCEAMGLVAPLSCAWSLRCLHSGVALKRCDGAPTTHPATTHVNRVTEEMLE